MGGITGSGLISGIDTASLIDQLIAVASGPKTLAQSRMIQLRAQQAAYLDLNSQLSSLKSAAAAFRVDSVFQTKKATSSNDSILTATASLGAQPGTYSFIVDRLVSSRQLLSQGFQDQDTSAIGATRFTFESYQGRLDRDLSLSALNDGAGIERGTIRVSDGTTTADIDLSRAATVQDVLDEINSSGLSVTARVRGGHFEIVGATSVSNAGTADTAESLGLIGTYDGFTAGNVGGTYTGFRVYELTDNISLSSLNDGNGVDYNSGTVTAGVAPDFTISIDGVDVKIGLGDVRQLDDGGTPSDPSDDTFPVIDPAVSTVGGLLDRINTTLSDAGYSGTVASIDAATGSLKFTSTDGNITAITQDGSANTLRDLGITEFTGGTSSTVTGSRIFSGMGSTLINNLNGGGSSGGIGGDGLLTFTDRSGTTATIDLNSLSFDTVEGLIDAVNTELSNNSVGITLSLNSAGTGLKAADTTGSTTGNLIITGSSGSDTAASLGLSTGATGVADDTFEGSSLQHRYISEATRLDSLNNGDGIGTGTFRLIDATGKTADVVIDDNEVTIADLINQIEGQISAGGLALSVGINSNGDGIVISDTSGTGTTIQIEDVSGTVASKLNLAGTADASGANNFIDGTFETVVDFDATDTLNDIVTKINDAGGPAVVSILNDGTGSRPYRLSFSARESGSAGRFTLDTNGFDLGLSVLDEGNDARVFFGSNDASTGILLTSSSNTLDNVITGVNIDLHSVSDEAVQITVTDDTGAIESKINEFIDAYNRVIDSINSSTRFDADTGDRGALLGDGLVLGLRGGLFSTVQSSNFGFSDSVNRLTEVGVVVGTDGKLEFDADTFREALASDPDAVEELFTRRTISGDTSQNDELPDGVSINDPGADDTFSELGVMVLLEEFAKTYTDSIDGILTVRSQSLDTQITSQQKRIDDLQAGLDRQRAALEQQFAAMEQALAQLQSQQAALSSLTQLG